MVLLLACSSVVVGKHLAATNDLLNHAAVGLDAHAAVLACDDIIGDRRRSGNANGSHGEESSDDGSELHIELFRVYDWESRTFAEKIYSRPATKNVWK